MSPILTTGGGAYAAAAGGGGSAWLLDQITPQPTAAYSTRKLKSSATNAIQLCDQSGATTGTCGFDGTDDLNQTTVGTFYTANSNCANCIGYYDQSGNGRNIISTVAGGSALLRWSTSIIAPGAIQTINSKPAVYFSYNDARDRVRSTTLHVSDLMTASAFTVIQSMRINSFFVTSSVPEQGVLCDRPTGYFGSACPTNYTPGSTGNVIQGYVYDGADKFVRIAASVNTNYVCVMRLSGGTLAVWVNGAGLTNSTACGNIGDVNSAFLDIGVAGSADYWLGDTLVYNTALSNADINTLCSASGVTNGNVASRIGATWTAI